MRLFDGIPSWGLEHHKMQLILLACSVIIVT